jgi:hypothetical protein
MGLFSRLKPKDYTELELHQSSFLEAKGFSETVNFNYNRMLEVYPYKVVHLKEETVYNFGAGKFKCVKGFLTLDTLNFLSLLDFIFPDPDDTTDIECCCITLPWNQIISITETYKPLASLKHDKDKLKDLGLTLDSDNNIMNVKTGEVFDPMKTK